MVSVQQAGEDFLECREILFPPGRVAGLLRINERADKPVHQLLMRHVGEATVEPALLIDRALRRREMVGDPHVVREGDAARMLGRIARKTHGVGVGVAAEEPVKLVTHGPRVHLHLEEELVDGEVERVEHPVFPLVHRPERFPFAFQELRAAIVAVNGLREHEGAGLAEFGLGEFFVERVSPFFQRGEVLQRIGGDGFKVGKIARVVVARVQTRGGLPRTMEANREAEGLLLSGLGAADEQSHAADAERMIEGVALIEDVLDAESQPGVNTRRVADDGQGIPAGYAGDFFQPIDKPHSAHRVIALKPEDRHAVFLLARIVHRQFHGQRGHIGQTKILVGSLSRLRRRHRRGVDGEGQIPRRPAVGTGGKFTLDRLVGP